MSRQAFLMCLLVCFNGCGGETTERGASAAGGSSGSGGNGGSQLEPMGDPICTAFDNPAILRGLQKQLSLEPEELPRLGELEWVRSLEVSQVTSLEELACLPRLRELVLTDPQTDDWSALSGIPLEKLQVYDVHIPLKPIVREESPLADHLETLTIACDQSRGQGAPLDLNSLQPDSRLTSLEVVGCTLEPLDRLPVYLLVLSLSNTGLEDLSSTSPPAHLLNLTLAGNQLHSFEFLANYPHLSFLSWVSDEVPDLTPLTSLNDLRTLYLEGFEKLSFDGPLPAFLSKLYVSGAAIENLASLSQLTRLRDLTLVSEAPMDLTPLSELEDLSYVELRGANHDLSPLEPWALLDSYCRIIFLDLFQNTPNAVGPVVDKLCDGVWQVEGPGVIVCDQGCRGMDPI